MMLVSFSINLRVECFLCRRVAPAVVGVDALLEVLLAVAAAAGHAGRCPSPRRMATRLLVADVHSNEKAWRCNGANHDARAARGLWLGSPGSPAALRGIWGDEARAETPSQNPREPSFAARAGNRDEDEGWTGWFWFQPKELNHLPSVAVSADRSVAVWTPLCAGSAG